MNIHKRIIVPWSVPGVCNPRRTAGYKPTARWFALLLLLALTFSARAALHTINVGTTANDGTGDPLRTAFNKLNSNMVMIVSDANTLSNRVVLAEATNAAQTVSLATGVTVANTLSNRVVLAEQTNATQTVDIATGVTVANTLSNRVVLAENTNATQTANIATGVTVANTLSNRVVLAENTNATQTANANTLSNRVTSVELQTNSLGTRITALETGGAGGSTNALTNASPTTAAGAIMKMVDRVTPTNSGIFVSADTNLTGVHNIAANNSISAPNMSSDVFNAGRIVLSNNLYAAASVKAIDGDLYDQYMQTNRLTAATSRVYTNGATGQILQDIVRGEASGGTDRNISVIIPPGDLLQDGDAAYATSLTVVCTNGIKWDFFVQKIKIHTGATIPTNLWVFDRVWRRD